MEEVCLNSEPVLDEVDEYEVGESSAMVEHNAIAGETGLKTVPQCPTAGLEFESYDKAYEFYNLYAIGQGFGIRVRNSWFRDKERYRAKLSCSNAGFKKASKANNPKPETRTGCPAMIILKLMDTKKWRIIQVELEHNHQVSPEHARSCKSHKKMILAAKRAGQRSPVMEVHTIKLYRMAGVDTSCSRNSNIRETEMRSPTEYLKHLKLKEGDVHAVYNFFCRMKLTNPNFFYLMDVDDEGRLRNVFWADFRSRVAYGYFSDTIAIDTLCLANRYDIPLVCFVGVNHHGQSVLLGCAFVGQETVDNFVWVFRAWLACMFGRPPQVIITDQSKSLRDAVSEVFPRAHHCYSLWYIMQRVPERLGGLNGYAAINKQFKKAVYKSLKIIEFETTWNSMVTQHKLQDNQWLQALYEDRERWVPVYLKDIFLAGMIPIQENEVLSSFFDVYLHKNTSFKDFVDKYEISLLRKHMKEDVADSESRCSFELKTSCSFELQLAKVYTKELFRNFQVEVEGMYSCFNTQQVKANGSIVTFVVKERVEAEGNEKEVWGYEVLYDASQADIRCICSLFNFRGYLCRHALKVLNYNGVEQVPSRYILPRWCKDFKRSCPLDNGSSNTDVRNPLNLYINLYNRAIGIVEEGSQSGDHYEAALQQLEGLLRKLSVMEDGSIQPRNVN
ncbi:hypothetical protein Ancab_040629 [Ancistrocladus abbreviatus]